MNEPSQIPEQAPTQPFQERNFARDRGEDTASPLSAALFAFVLIVCMLISAFLRFVGPAPIPQHSKPQAHKITSF